MRIASSLRLERKVRLPVVERAARIAGIQHRVHLAVRQRPDDIHDGCAERLDRLRPPLSPSSSGPQWHTTIAASFVPDPSGAWIRPPKTMSSSGSDAVMSRKKRSTSQAALNG